MITPETVDQRGLGLELRADLLGDDRPEEVARRYLAETAWLSGEQGPGQPSAARPRLR